MGRLKAWSERLSGKQENNGVYFGKNDTLINRLDEPDYDTLMTSAGFVNALVNNVDVPVYFGIIPLRQRSGRTGCLRALPLRTRSHH